MNFLHFSLCFILSIIDVIGGIILKFDKTCYVYINFYQTQKKLWSYIKCSSVGWKSEWLDNIQPERSMTTFSQNVPYQWKEKIPRDLSGDVGTS